MKGKAVIYIDGHGKEHDAIVRAVNNTYPGYVDLVYVDLDALDSDNLKTLYSIAHMSDESKQETNPALPTIHLNCWKEFYEQHTAPASDHPIFDHPFAEHKDEFGKRIEPARPEYEAQVREHRDSLPSAEDLDAVAQEQSAADATAGGPTDRLRRRARN